MNEPTRDAPGEDDIFSSAEWYDRSINWSARFGRELPVLTDVLGPPGKGGLIDAGCGTGRHVCALTERGYRVVGADLSADMLALARQRAKACAAEAEFVQVPFASMYEELGGGFDGVYCLANSLAAAGSSEGVSSALIQFSKCLRTGGRLFVQIRNFTAMLAEVPTIHGPRVSVADGIEYVSVRQFRAEDGAVIVTNITLWQDDGWHKRVSSGRLYPIELDELRSSCESASLRIDELWGSYAREPFDQQRSEDLLLVATRK
ncbi:MAG: class I SAM-dependent methyltransferase [Planctomycetes bacterium]|nr:class I SAM-dependent methyltransferase [Planctomycetota bacterium]